MGMSSCVFLVFIINVHDMKRKDFSWEGDQAFDYYLMPFQFL